jgi:ketosteroid isomerase-like protein
MKRITASLIAAALLFACNNEKKEDDSNAGEKKEAAASIAYPYKAAYSAEFSIGNAKHSKLVLDLYKMWEEGKIDDMRPLLADSVFVEGYDGMKFNNTVDSFLNFAKQFRAGYSSVKTVFDTWMPVHHQETGEDYVLVWNKDYSTTTDGKTDSLRVHAYFEIRNDKVRGWSEFQQKLAPQAPPPPARK